MEVVWKLVNDMVIIRYLFKFVWDIVFNWQDYKEIKEWDVIIFR